MITCEGAKAFDFEDSADGDPRRRPDLLVGKDQLSRSLPNRRHRGGACDHKGHPRVVAAHRLKSLKLM